MSKETYTEFTKQLSTYITNNQNNTPPPMIGVITHVSQDLQYCDVTTDQGTIPDIPAHGLPVNGDSAIIHFINGNYEQPVADCARRLPATEDVVDAYYTMECYNYHENGDFSSDDYGYTGEYQLTGEEYYTSTTPQCMLLSDNTKYTEFTVALPSDVADVIKLQAYYKGAGTLRIQATNTSTGETIQTIPYNTSTTYKTWTTQESRWTWDYNKITYPTTTTTGKTLEEITFRIENTSTTTTEYIDGVAYTSRPAMLIDGILVYDENNDKEYYQNVNDVKT